MEESAIIGETDASIAFGNYTAPEYEPPRIVEVVGRALSIHNDGGCSIADFFSPDRNAQEDYINGFVGLGLFLLAIFGLWYLFLLLLKLKGSDVGCASGRAFSVPTAFPHESDELLENDERRMSNLTLLMIDKEERFTSDRESSSSSSPSTFNGALPSTPPSPNEDETCFSGSRRSVQRRMRNTRLVYFVFACFSIACSGLFFTHTYNSMAAATSTFLHVITEGQSIVDEVHEVIQYMKDNMDTADAMIETIPLDYQELCPKVPPSQFENTLGVDPQDIIFFLEREIDDFMELAREKVGMVEKATVQVSDIMVNVDDPIRSVQEYSWAIPMVVDCIVVLTAMSIAGVLVATYNGDTGRIFEPFLAWIGLPLMIFWTLIGWALVIGFCFGSIATSDVCIAQGTPDATLLTILNSQGLHNGTVFEFISAYTIEGCSGDNPLKLVLDLEDFLEENLVLMRTRLDEADAIGYENLEELCGEGNHVTPFFMGILELESQLTSVHTGLRDASDMLSCPRINSMYTRAVYVSICTEFAYANATGFVLLLAVTLSTMVLVSLRASWRASEQVLAIP